MTSPLGTLRLAAVNIDGVLLSDTFSPVLHRLAAAHGLAYTPELEYTLLSQPQHAAAAAFAAAAGRPGGARELLGAFFAERERYVRRHPVRLLEGALELLRRLRRLGLDLVCYGGLEAAHFERHLGPWASWFTEPGYVCTDAFRPGVEEITREVFRLGYHEVLFIDDVARCAEQALARGVCFVGRPTDFAHGFQRRLMQRAGVAHLVSALDEIDEPLLRLLDREAGARAAATS
ncbi:HAD family phosphatase [Streptomyces sp. R21]|uniref:HAD family phosphatase n=1 Tax=Streptomyces sp. R21 TaxID=3238627 RepID=A0AB39NXP0_9ACTN